MEPVRDYMTAHLQVISPEASLVDSIKLMRDHRVGSVLIKENEHVVGIFTERDLLNRIDFSRLDVLGTLVVRDVMTSSPFVIEAHESYIKAIDVMQSKNIRHLPVVEQGNVIGIVSLRDLMSHYEKHLEAMLIQKKAIETLVNHMQDGIVICTLDWKIKEINISAKRYLEVGDTAAVDIVDYLFSHFEVSISRAELTEIRRLPLFDVIRRETESSNALILEVHVSRIENPIDNTSNIVLSLRDVTSQRKEDRLKQDFLGLISHKLRTPIVSIISIATLMRDGALGELTSKQKEKISHIEAKATQFRSIINKLMGFNTLVDQSLGGASRVDIPLAEHLVSLQESIKAQFPKRQITLEVLCNPQTLCISMSVIHLDLLLMNLIENAVKFSDKNDIHIHCSAQEEGDALQLIVRDNGRGIPAEELTNIFGRFYQVEKYFTGNIEGVGLGLALVRNIVDTYGGAIAVESKIGQGSCFTISLPRDQKNICETSRAV